MTTPNSNTRRPAENNADETTRKTSSGKKTLPQENFKESPPEDGKKKASSEAPPRVEGKPEVKPAKAETKAVNEKAAPKGDGKPASEKKPRKPKSKKNHKKKGTASDAPPASIGMTQLALSALRTIEVANPEMTRKQIIENALKLLAGHIAYLPAIELARLDSNTLIILAAVAAEREKACKRILRDVYSSQCEDEEKAKHSAELEKEIQSLKDNRLIMLRMAGIPISHDLITNMDIVIAELMLLKEKTSSKTLKQAFDDAILILTAYKPIAPMATAKPAGEPPQDQESKPKAIATLKPKANPETHLETNQTPNQHTL